jgi:hypothetical protein
MNREIGQDVYWKQNYRAGHAEGYKLARQVYERIDNEEIKKALKNIYTSIDFCWIFFRYLFVFSV